MQKQKFTPSEDDNKIFDDYVKSWQQWPTESKTTKDRVDDLEDFTLDHESLLFDLYAKIDRLTEEVRQLTNGKQPI
jgi:hypothetical protein